MNKKERKIIGILSLGHFVSDGWHILYPAILFLLEKEFTNDFTFLGALGTAFLIGAGSSGVISGILFDKIGGKILLTAFSLITALGALLVFFSDQKFLLILSMIIFGIGTGIFHPVGLAAITRNFRKTSNALGIFGFVGNFGLAIIPLLGIIIGVLQGWRTTFLFASITCLILLPFIPLLNIKHGENPKQTKPSSSQNKTFNLKLTGLYIIQTFRQFAMSGILTFAPIILLKTTFLEGQTIGIIPTIGICTSIIMIIGAFGTLLGGKTADRSKPELYFIIACLMPIIPLFLLWIFHANALLILLLIPLTFFLMQISEPISGSLVGKYLNEKHHGKGFAMLYGVGSVIGATSGVILGISIDQFGFSSVYLLIMASLIFIVPLFFTFFREKQLATT